MVTRMWRASSSTIGSRLPASDTQSPWRKFLPRRFTWVPGGPCAGENEETAGGRSMSNARGERPEPARPRTVKTSLRVARRGTSTSIQPAPRPSTAMERAPYDTLSDGAKPEPVILTRVPGGPLSGLNPAMTGVRGRTRKRAGLRARSPLGRPRDR